MGQARQRGTYEERKVARMQQPKLVIEILPDGRLNVNGPIENKMLCYGMLELAKDAIRDHAEKNRSMIVPVKTLPLHPQGN